MKDFYTAVVERVVPVVSEHTTEPYETGWADEALVFVKVRAGLLDQSTLRAQVQVSPDGIDWADLPDVAAVLNGRSMAAVPVRGFGGWLRVALSADQDQPVVVSVYLALKG